MSYDHYVVAYLEMMHQPYTGCNPRGMMISRDKVLTKRVLASHRIPTPRFQLFPRGRRFRAPRRLQFPMIVKSATEDASLGISQASIVDDMAICASGSSSFTIRPKATRWWRSTSKAGRSTSA